jgi:hypothetical protein
VLSLPGIATSLLVILVPFSCLFGNLLDETGGTGRVRSGSLKRTMENDPLALPWPPRANGRIIRIRVPRAHSYQAGGRYHVAGSALRQVVERKKRPPRKIP